MDVGQTRTRSSHGQWNSFQSRGWRLCHSAALACEFLARLGSCCKIEQQRQLSYQGGSTGFMMLNLKVSSVAAEAGSGMRLASFSVVRVSTL